MTNKILFNGRETFVYLFYNRDVLRSTVQKPGQLCS